MEETAMVRPYLVTGGRTKASRSLELETMISTRKGVVADQTQGPDEQREIVEACIPAPRSVAEIASDLHMPLGVTRVLVGDAADAGLVKVHRTASPADGGQSHLRLMERVLDGLRRL